MINKKLLSFDRGALRYVGANVAFQWLGMLCNVIFVRAIAQLVGAAFAGSLTSAQLWQNLVLCLATVPMRFAFTMLASAMSDQASKDVKRTLRSSIYAKLARLGPNYTETAATSEVVMLASEGVEQIDTYFAKYLPQLFYSLLAPVTLFVLLVGVHARSAIILLCCVPLIPMSIVAVQKFAKKLLANYWGEYTTLGDSFLENIQGLTTLKIYGADGVDFSKPFCLGYTGLSDELLQKYIHDSEHLWKDYAKELPVSTLGATIGTHVGPGAIAVAFFEH